MTLSGWVARGGAVVRKLRRCGLLDEQKVDDRERDDDRHSDADLHIARTLILNLRDQENGVVLLGLLVVTHECNAPWSLAQESDVSARGL